MLIVSIGRHHFAVEKIADAESLMRILSAARLVELRTFHMLDRSPEVMRDETEQVDITLRISRAKAVSADEYAELERQNQERRDAFDQQHSAGA